MPNGPNKLMLFEWIAGIAWTIFWGSLAFIAISERSITLGGRYGITHYDGLSAVIGGFIHLGASMFGLYMLLRTHPFKRLLRLLLFLGWLCSFIIYFLYYNL